MTEERNKLADLEVHAPDHAIKSVPTLFLAVSAVESGHSEHEVTVRVGRVDCCECCPSHSR